MNETGDGIIIDKISLDISRSPSIYLPSQMNGIDVVQVGNGTVCLETTGTGSVSISIPDTVRRIENYAFLGCEALNSVSGCEGLTEIGLEVFYGTKYQESKAAQGTDMIFNDTILYRCFTTNPEYTVPDEITYIAADAFRDNHAIETVILPATVTTICDGAFFNCTALRSIVMPESLVTLGNTVFGECSALTSVALNQNLQNIGQNIFYACDALESVTAPENSTAADWIAQNFPS